MDYDRKGYVWKIYLDKSYNTPSHHSYLFQKKLRISICDLYNVGDKGFIAEYKCPNILSSETNVYNHFSLLSMFKDNYKKKSRLNLCLPNVDRVLFRFKYISNHKLDRVYNDDDILNRELIKNKQKTRRKEKPMKLSKLFKKNFKSVKEIQAKSVHVPKHHHEVQFEVGAFCRSKPYKCYRIMFDTESNDTTKSHSDKYNGNTSRQNNKNYYKNISPEYIPPNFRFRFDKSGEFVHEIFPVSTKKKLASNTKKYFDAGNFKQTENFEKSNQEKLNGKKYNKNSPNEIDLVQSNADMNDKTTSDVCSMYAALENIDWEGKGGSQRFDACNNHRLAKEIFFK